jgi:hypothetical protein
MCSSNSHGLTIYVSIMVKYVCYTGLWIHWFRDPDATIPNDSVTIGRTSVVGVGHSRSDSIMPLILRMICCAIAGTLTLYYRSLGTASTLLRRSNILFTSYTYIIYYIYITYKISCHDETAFAY